MSLTMAQAGAEQRIGWHSVAARATLLLALSAGLAAGWLVGHPGETAAVTAAGDDLARLLRAMAALKLLFVAAATAATLWRLQSPIGPGRLALYAVTTAAMATGPGLVWTLTHVGLGAILLHLGLFATVLLLWRDPVVGTLLTVALQRRRAAQAAISTH